MPRLFVHTFRSVIWAALLVLIMQYGFGVGYTMSVAQRAGDFSGDASALSVKERACRGNGLLAQGHASREHGRRTTGSRSGAMRGLRATS